MTAGEFRAGTRHQLTRTAGLEADAQHPALPLGVCAGQLDEVIDLAHSAFRRGDDVTSGDSGPHTAGVALEDAHPELMLQLAQGVGQRGLADVQDLGGATEIASLLDGDHVAQLGIFQTRTVSGANVAGFMGTAMF